MSSFQELEENLLDSVNTINERGCLVIKKLYGLDGNDRLSPEEIGLLLNVPKQNIRQIEARCFRLMKHPKRSQPLREYSKYLNTMKLYSSIYWNYWR